MKRKSTKVSFVAYGKRYLEWSLEDIQNQVSLFFYEQEKMKRVKGVEVSDILWKL